MKLRNKQHIMVGSLDTITIIDKNLGVGASISHDGTRIVHVERLAPADWGDFDD